MASFALESTAATLEARIRTHRLMTLPIPWQDELIYPHYTGLSLYNLAQTIAHLFDVPASAPLDDAVWGGESPAGQVDRVVIFISDGLGYLLLKRLMEELPDMAETVRAITDGRGFVPLSSVAPSTTACALPTFWTARHPGTHGMVGTAMLLREFGMIADMLNYSPGAAAFARTTHLLDPWGIPANQFIPLQSLPEQLAAQGVPLHLLIGAGLFGTGLSRLMHKGIHKQTAYNTLTDLFPQLHTLLKQTRGQRGVIVVYTPNVDTLSHAYGYDTGILRTEITLQLEGLRAVLTDSMIRDGRTLALITADHGHYDSPVELDLDKDPLLLPVRKAMRLPFGGDERFGYLYLREGTRAQVIDTFAEHFSRHAAVIDGETAVASGLFGEAAHPELLNRVGDLIVLPRQGVRLVDTARPMRMVSIHAGLGEWDMLTPLLWTRL
jgi:hypothetical protein